MSKQKTPTIQQLFTVMGKEGVEITKAQQEKIAAWLNTSFPAFLAHSVHKYKTNDLGIAISSNVLAFNDIDTLKDYITLAEKEYGVNVTDKAPPIPPKPTHISLHPKQRTAKSYPEAKISHTQDPTEKYTAAMRKIAGPSVKLGRVLDIILDPEDQHDYQIKKKILAELNCTGFRGAATRMGDKKNQISVDALAKALGTIGIPSGEFQNKEDVIQEINTAIEKAKASKHLS